LQWWGSSPGLEHGRQVLAPWATAIDSYTFPFFLSFFLPSFFFYGAGIWTQGLHLEPLHQPFIVMSFFWDRVSWTICLGWLRTMILLISASWVARITGMSHRHPACIFK
jgi:hypothetical protein